MNIEQKNSLEAKKRSRLLVFMYYLVPALTMEDGEGVKFSVSMGKILL